MANNDIYVYEGEEEVPRNVVRVLIHRSVRIIPEKTFENCDQLTSVEFAGGPVVIEYYAFHWCTSLERIVFSSPTSCVTDIGEYAFYNCRSLVSVQFPEGLVRINDDAFSRCSSLESIQLPSTVTEIGTEAFYDCTNLVSVQLHEGLLKIGVQAFCLCSSLESFSVPSTVTEIGRGAFDNCPNLASVQLNEGLQTIEDNAFLDCPSLERFQFFHLSERMATMNLDEQRETELDNKIREISAAAKRGGEDWTACKESLEQVHEVLTYWELKEATTNLELSLWKAKLRDEAERPQQGEGTNNVDGQQAMGNSDHMLSRNECRIKSGADVVIKSTLKYFTYSLDW